MCRNGGGEGLEAQCGKSDREVHVSVFSPVSSVWRYSGCQYFSYPKSKQDCSETRCGDGHPLVGIVLSFAKYIMTHLVLRCTAPLTLCGSSSLALCPPLEFPGEITEVLHWESLDPRFFFNFCADGDFYVGDCLDVFAAFSFLSAISFRLRKTGRTRV